MPFLEVEYKMDFTEVAGVRLRLRIPPHVNDPIVVFETDSSFVNNFLRPSVP